MAADSAPPTHPISDPAEATAVAYSVEMTGPVLTGGPRPMWSRARLRAMLNVVAQQGGAVAKQEENISFTYGDSSKTVVTARPARARMAECLHCGQWEREHRDPDNVSACKDFAPEPKPGTAENPRCTRCSQPKTHHSRQFTVACEAFTLGDPNDE
ncbi:hypothetical protein [Streptomyces sp. NEAU-174]|uniref:hypothetical protein n=1 Tax=Streptomyces sp. NEAU-174 TaxID=3458254 RepID=UPI004044FE53